MEVVILLYRVVTSIGDRGKCHDAHFNVVSHACVLSVGQSLEKRVSCNSVEDHTLHGYEVQVLFLSLKCT